MQGAPRGDVEILVHTTAPSRGQDDARYRALARAYLDFEPARIRRMDVESSNDLENELDRQADSQVQQELLDSTNEERESAASYRPDDEPETERVGLSQASFTHRDLGRVSFSQGFRSPELSFNSALNNADSPPFRSSAASLQNSPDMQRRSQKQCLEDSWQPPPSVIEDSQPDNNKTLPTLTSPTKVLELYHQDFDCSVEPTSEIRSKGKETSGLKPQLAAGSQLNQLTLLRRRAAYPSSISSVHPSTSLDNDAEKYSKPMLKYRKHIGAVSQDPGLSAKRKWLQFSSDDAPALLLAAGKLAVDSSTVSSAFSPSSRKLQYTESGRVKIITQSQPITSSRATGTTTSIASNAESSWIRQLEIRPPMPPTSTTDLTPEMLVTQSLQQIALKMPLAMLFRPQDQTRDLRSMERGHWRVSCQSWDPDLRKRSWDCLGNFVGEGMAGWGIWCIRDEQFDTMRVYCWGTVVGHIYLLLYMASESKIKATGASWIGGDGEAIIQMPS